ncbi:prevent-host-death protein [Mycobacterium servetii]|uniref:Prevent-host-death protein n=1 Tax=Mycobacterium servetii TaxID=3237418 RepID=A0ABV4C935_9MYCO
MTASAWFNSVTEGRAHLRKMLDAAARGLPAGLRRDQAAFALVDGERLRRFLEVQARQPEVIAEADGWSIFIPNTPLSADGPTLAEAATDMIDALREYATDWTERLHAAPNHADNWWIPQLSAVSTDDELSSWLTAGQLAGQA